MTDAAARRLQETILRLRRATTSNPDIALSIVQMIRELSEGMAGEAIHHLAATPSAAEFTALPVERRRAVIATHAQFGILPPGAGEEVRVAMLALNGGQANDLVRPTASHRRGENRYDVASLELHLLAWIAWQQGNRHGAGKEALAEVAAAVGRTCAAVRKWRAELADQFGSAHVNAVLEKEKAEGRAARQAGSAQFPRLPMRIAAARLRKMLPKRRLK